MFTRSRGQVRAWRRIAAGVMGVTLAIPAMSTAAAAAPTPDVLDVDFTTGQTADQLSGNEPKRYGYPVLNHGTVWFDGEDDAYFYPIDWAPLAGGFSLECMFKWTDPGIRASTCSGTGSGGLTFQVEPSGSLQFVAHIGGAYRTTTATTLQADRWYHAVGTWNGNTIRVYLNGELVGQQARTGAFQAPPLREGLALGAATAGINAVTRHVESEFARMRIFGQALTGTAIADLSDQAWQALPPRPAAPADVLDVDYGSGQEYDQVSGTEPRTFGNPAVAPDTEIGREVATFDGDDAYLVPTIDWPALSSGFSAECMFKVDQPVTGLRYPCAGAGSGGIAFELRDGASLKFAAHIGGGYKHIAMPTGLGVGQWYHAVTTWDGETLRLYVDGELVNELAAAGAFGIPSQSGFAVGADTSGQDQVTANLTGEVAIARVYDVVLDRSEISWLNDAARTPIQVELASTTPEPGAELTEAVPFEADLDVAAGEQLTQRRYQLDGEPIQFGDLVGPGLSPGPHAITMSAVDSSERTLQWSVPFTTTAMLNPGGTETVQGDGVVTLSAMATDPDGGNVTTTFRAATATTVEQGWQGKVAGIPETLDFEFEGQEVINEPLFPDGQTVASPASPRIPFQRFDVAVADPVAGQIIEWVGVVDSGRAVSLRAWDRLQGMWATLATAQGVDGAQTALRGRLRPGLVTDGVAHVMVTGDDPFADNLAPRDESANDPENRDHFEDPASYDFSFVHHSDPQHSTEGAAGVVKGIFQPGEYFAKEREAFADSYTDAMEWIANNAAPRKIAFSGNSGDLIQSLVPVYDNEAGRAAARKEYEFASSAQQILDDAGVVNQVIAGNHDNNDGDDSGPEAMLNDYFGPDRYYAAQQNWPAAANASYHAWDEVTDENGNTVTPGTDNSNNYVLFEAGGLEFVAVGLSYGVTQQEADWASSIFERYSDRNGILITHSYLRASSEPDGRGGALLQDGSVLYQEVVTANPNVFLVLTGHVHGVATRIDRDLGVSVDEQHNVVQLLANYQNYEVSAGEIWPELVRADGTIDLDGDGTADRRATDPYQLGASFIRMLQFDADRGLMSVDTYSPFLDNYGATEYDPNNSFNGAEDNFTVPVALSSRTTRFETDALTLITPTDDVIGEETVSSGSPASVEWTGLTEGEFYAWTATSRTSSGGVIKQVTQHGGPFVATAAGTQ